MSTNLIDIAVTAVELLDATGDFDARLWTKAAPRFVRVYVTTTGRKSKDCGYFSIGRTVDYTGLTRQCGTIQGVVEAAISAALPNLPEPAPVRRARRCDECGHGHMDGHRMDCALAE